jgi:hypothetical protein
LAWAAGGLGLLIMVTILIILGLPGDPIPADEEIAFARRLVEWEAPTDYLLAVSDAEIMNGIPFFENSVLRLPGFSEGAGTARTDY